MGCSNACDEGHTYLGNCALRGTTVADVPARRIQHLSSQCANSLCPNQPHEGRFVLVTFPDRRTPLALFMCVPCAEKLAEAM